MTTLLLTFDYLCPFARNANEHAVAAMAADEDLDITFTPYSLMQGHVEDGEPDVWDFDEPNEASGILALQAGLAVREHDPDHFAAVHLALFAARHDQGLNIKDRDVVRAALSDGGTDADAMLGIVDTGDMLGVLRAEHDRNVDFHQVWGVPTFIGSHRAVFVRLMDRPGDDSDLALERIREVVDLVETSPHLHEFKQVDLTV